MSYSMAGESTVKVSAGLIRTKKRIGCADHLVFLAFNTPPVKLSDSASYLSLNGYIVFL